MHVHMYAEAQRPAHRGSGSQIVKSACEVGPGPGPTSQTPRRPFAAWDARLNKALHANLTFAKTKPMRKHWPAPTLQ